MTAILDRRGQAFAETSDSVTADALRSLLEARESRLQEISQELGNTLNNQELLQEALAELELALEDVGWMRMSGFGDREFSVSGLRKIRRLARLFYLKNPLIRRAVEVQTHYVWGQGCSIKAVDEQLNDVVQAFLDNPKNTVSFSGHQARLDNERMQQVHGDTFFALFTNKNTGRVIVRKIHPDEISDIITNPDDYQEPWYYKRIWSERRFDVSSGADSVKEKVAYYPDWRFTYNRDASIDKPSEIGSNPVLWDAPIYHVKTGAFGDMKFGCPEVYPAIDWARAVRELLENYATIIKAHAQFAFKLTTKGGKAGVAAGKKLLGSTLSQDGSGQTETNPPATTASTWIQAQGWDLNPMKTAGSMPSPEEGRRLGLMVGAAVGLPETILWGNADVGNLATAKSLDRPTELQMENRRTMWSDVTVDILNYVVDQAVLRPNGKLTSVGEEVVDDEDEAVSVDFGETSRSITVTFPSILERDTLARVQAIVQAATLNNGANAGLFSDEMLAGWLMNALGEDEIDEALDLLFPDNYLTFDAGLPDPNKAQQSVGSQGMGDMGDQPPGPPITAPATLPGGSSLLEALREVKAAQPGFTGTNGSSKPTPAMQQALQHLNEAINGLDPHRLETLRVLEAFRRRLPAELAEAVVDPGSPPADYTHHGKGRAPVPKGGKRAAKKPKPKALAAVR